MPRKLPLTTAAQSWVGSTLLLWWSPAPGRGCGSNIVEVPEQQQLTRTEQLPRTGPLWVILCALLRLPMADHSSGPDGILCPEAAATLCWAFIQLAFQPPRKQATGSPPSLHLLPRAGLTAPARHLWAIHGQWHLPLGVSKDEVPQFTQSMTISPILSAWVDTNHRDKEKQTMHNLT